MLVQMLMALLLGGLVACLAFYHAKDASNPAQGENFYHGQHITDPHLCHRLIAGKSLSDTHRNLLQPLGSRAEDNRRLVDAFNIDNAFTSADEVYVKHFVKEAQSRISLTSEQWKVISGLAQYAVRGWTESSQSVSEHDDHITIRIKLASMVQAVCLRVVLKILFKIEKEVASDDQLVSLAEAINRAWIVSKTQEGSRYGEDRDLQNALSAVFPDTNVFEPRENPLNFILPAFETLWRIVLRTFVEVKFTTGSKHPEWQDILIAFAGDPTKSQFELKAAEWKGISAEFIVSEALRLYPPTRRVHRTFKWTTTGEQISIAADIEACHTASKIWGPHALTFNPARFGKLTREQKGAFMPFGAAQFICPAKPVFGPRIIGLLAGTLLSELKNDWELNSDNAKVMEELNIGNKLCLNREAYEDVFLVRIRRR